MNEARIHGSNDMRGQAGEDVYWSNEYIGHGSVRWNLFAVTDTEEITLTWNAPTSFMVLSPKCDTIYPSYNILVGGSLYVKTSTGEIEGGFIPSWTYAGPVTYPFYPDTARIWLHWLYFTIGPTTLALMSMEASIALFVIDPPYTEVTLQIQITA